MARVNNDNNNNDDNNDDIAGPKKAGQGGYNVVSDQPTFSRG